MRKVWNLLMTTTYFCTICTIYIKDHCTCGNLILNESCVVPLWVMGLCCEAIRKGFVQQMALWDLSSNNMGICFHSNTQTSRYCHTINKGCRRSCRERKSAKAESFCHSNCILVYASTGFLSPFVFMQPGLVRFSYFLWVGVHLHIIVAVMCGCVWTSACLCACVKLVVPGSVGLCMCACVMCLLYSHPLIDIPIRLAI